MCKSADPAKPFKNSRISSQRSGHRDFGSNSNAHRSTLHITSTFVEIEKILGRRSRLMYRARSDHAPIEEFMKIRFAFAALAASVVFLSGCGGDSKVTDDPKTGSNASTKEAESEPDPEETTEAPKENPKFGQTVTYENGIQVTVGKPKSTKITEYAAMTKKWKSYQAFEVVVVNNSGKNFDVSGLYFTMQSNDEEAEQIFDEGFDGAPSTTLLDGRQSKFRIGFGVNNPEDMVLELELGDFESEPTIYTN